MNWRGGGEVGKPVSLYLEQKNDTQEPIKGKSVLLTMQKASGSPHFVILAYT